VNAEQKGTDAWAIILATLSLVGGLFTSVASSFSGFMSYLMRYDKASYLTQDIFLAKKMDENFNNELKRSVSLRYED